MTSSADINFKGLRFLIVDDEKAVLSQLKNWLSSAGAVTSLAESGNEAIELLKYRSFDVVISDVRMPDGNARDIMTWLQSQASPSPLVVLISAFSEVQEYLVCQMGSESFLTKPVQKEILFTEILKAVQSRHKEKAS